VRTELARQAPSDTAAGRLAAGLAAAAMLAFTVGLLQFATPVRNAAGSETLELFAASLEAVMAQQDSELIELREDVATYEAQFAADSTQPYGWLEPYGVELLEGLNGLSDEQEAAAKG
jgi:hypothetical protein